MPWEPIQIASRRSTLLMATESRVLVFTKAPQPGSVKTRLAPLLGVEGAAALHRRLIAHTLEQAASAGAGPVELWCDPDCTDAFLDACARRYGASLHAQNGADLGERMLRAFVSALRISRSAVLVGTDCAVLSSQHLHAATDALTAGDEAVFCPAEDGGYALIGLARCDAALFNGIRWGGPDVMAATRVRLREAGMRWTELATLWDIDRPEDYQRLVAGGHLNLSEHAPTSDSLSADAALRALTPAAAGAGGSEQQHRRHPR
jgi:rSAM/selenodomain-associated transferase 1